MQSYNGFNVFAVQGSGVHIDNAEQRALFPGDRLSVQGNHANHQGEGTLENAYGPKLRAHEGAGLHGR